MAILYAHSMSNLTNQVWFMTMVCQLTDLRRVVGEDTQVQRTYKQG